MIGDVKLGFFLGGSTEQPLRQQQMQLAVADVLDGCGVDDEIIPVQTQGHGEAQIGGETGLGTAVGVAGKARCEGDVGKIDADGVGGGDDVLSAHVIGSDRNAGPVQTDGSSCTVNKITAAIFQHLKIVAEADKGAAVFQFVHTEVLLGIVRQ